MTPEIELKKDFDPVESKKKLDIPADWVLDIEIKQALKLQNMSKGLELKEATLSARKTFDKFWIFLDINFKRKYFRQPPFFKRQKPGSDFVTWCFRPELRDLLMRFGSVEQLKRSGFEEIEFDNDEFAVIKKCFLELFPKVNNV